MNTMQSFHAIGLRDVGVSPSGPSISFAQARRQLNRRTANRHLQQALSGLLRGATIAVVYLTGRYALDGAPGDLLVWTAFALCPWLGWYVGKGHLAIHRDRRAKLYWLENDADNGNFCSNDPLLATMPVQNTVQPRGRAVS
jgi:hypothetical protein